MSSTRKVKLPHNNRVNASSALRTNDMWAITIGAGGGAATASTRDLETEEQLLQLAKLAKSGGGENRGTCTKCNQLGHLSFQCRNSVKQVVNELSSSSSDSDDDDDNAIPIPSRKRVRSNSRSRSRERNDSGREKDKKHKKEKKHKKDKKNKKDKKEKKEKRGKEKVKKEKGDQETTQCFG